MQVEANRSGDEYDPSHQHRARRSLKNAALGKYLYISICYSGYDCLFATIILSHTCQSVTEAGLELLYYGKDFWEFDT